MKQPCIRVARVGSFEHFAPPQNVVNEDQSALTGMSNRPLGVFSGALFVGVNPNQVEQAVEVFQDN